jgi:hypothetical protein
MKYISFLFVMLRNGRVESAKRSRRPAVSPRKSNYRYVEPMRTRIYDEVQAEHRWPTDIGFAPDLADTPYSGRRRRDSPRRAITPLNIHKFITSGVGRIHPLPFRFTLLPFTSCLYFPVPLTQVTFSK